MHTIVSWVTWFWTRFVLDRRNFLPPWRCPATWGLAAACVYFSLATNFAGRDEKTGWSDNISAANPYLTRDYQRVDGTNSTRSGRFDKVNEGELWRLVVPEFIHGSVDHLVGNLVFVLLMYGQVEYQLGSMRFLLLLFLPVTVLGRFICASLSPSVETLGISDVNLAVAGYIMALKAMDRRADDYFSFKLFAMLGALQSVASGLVQRSPTLAAWFGLEHTSVGNIAHMSGLILGVLFGLWSCSQPRDVFRKPVASVAKPA